MPAAILSVNPAKWGIFLLQAKMKKLPGLIYLFTGDGKGKTSASLGVALRAMGWGWRVLMIQFIKMAQVGEHRMAQQLGNFTIWSLGEGWYRIMGDKKPEEVHRRAAQEAWKMAKKEIFRKRKSWDLIILDELNNAVNYGFLEVSEVVKTLVGKPEGLNLIITGRGAHYKIMEAADLVTKMEKIKHPYDRGIGAVRGLDF